MYFSRGANKVKNPYCLKDMYEDYIKDKEEGTVYHVDYRTYVFLVTEYYKAIGQYILDGGLHILPYRMGTLSVGKSRPKKLTSANTSIDWANSVKYNKQIRYTNDHSNQYKYRFVWSKKDCYVANKTNYRLVFTRTLKRELAKRIKSGEYEYFTI